MHVLAELPPLPRPAPGPVPLGEGPPGWLAWVVLATGMTALLAAWRWWAGRRSPVIDTPEPPGEVVGGLPLPAAADIDAWCERVRSACVARVGPRGPALTDAELLAEGALAGALTAPERSVLDAVLKERERRVYAAGAGQAGGTWPDVDELVSLVAAIETRSPASSGEGPAGATLP